MTLHCPLTLLIFCTKCERNFVFDNCMVHVVTEHVQHWPGLQGEQADSWQLCQPIRGKLIFWKNMSTNDRQLVRSCHSVDNIEWQILKSVQGVGAGRPRLWQRLPVRQDCGQVWVGRVSPPSSPHWCTRAGVLSSTPRTAPSRCTRCRRRSKCSGAATASWRRLGTTPLSRPGRWTGRAPRVWEDGQ